MTNDTNGRPALHLDKPAAPQPGSIDYWIDTCRGDLTRLADDLRWAHANGHWPTGRWIDAERGTDLSRGEDERLGRAARYDIGLGDHPSRTALERATTLLVHVDIHLAHAVVALGTRSAQPGLVRADQHRTLANALAVVAAARMRVDVIAEDLAFIDDRRTLRRVRAELDAGGTTLYAAVQVLGRALNRGSPTAAKPTPWCTICRIRPCRPGDKKRCETCHSWKQRHRGRERPRKLDRDENNPRTAAKQRLERGEGWGAA